MPAYVIEDHPLMREALTMLIHRIRPDLKVIPVSKINLLETAVVKNGSPELFCLDLQLPDTLGLSGVQIIKDKYPMSLWQLLPALTPVSSQSAAYMLVRMSSLKNLAVQHKSFQN